MVIGKGSESEFHRALSMRLSTLRLERQTSQGTLASELGTDQGAISRVESNQRRLNVWEAFAWLEALGLSAEDSAVLLQEIWTQHGLRPPGFWHGGKI